MIEEEIFRSVLGRFSTGITVVTAREANGRDHGMTVSAFSSVSLAPPLVMVCIGHDASMHGILMAADRIGINILGSAQEAMSRRFAEQDSDRFEGVGFARGESGVALLEDALAHLECHVISRQEAGDHTLMVAEVERARANEGKPLLYYRGGYAQLER